MTKKELAQLKKDTLIHTHLAGYDLTFRTTWGLFSPKEIDPGTKVLLDHIEIGQHDTILDLGCGYGPIGVTLAKQTKGHVYMVDKDFLAIEYAHKNAEANKCNNTDVMLSNFFSHVPTHLTFDVIVSNVPAKVGNELLQILLHEAKERLNPGGKLYVVVIGGLKDYFKRNFKEIFGNYKKVKTSGTYTVSYAEKQ